jgi:hypothetical protein
MESQAGTQVVQVLYVPQSIAALIARFGCAMKRRQRMEGKGGNPDPVVSVHVIGPVTVRS